MSYDSSRWMALVSLAIADTEPLATRIASNTASLCTCRMRVRINVAEAWCWR